ncbi:MAG TPA: GspE/PulE family protein [Candidatus Deferrimicrobiaceae bacterium]
MNESTEKMKIGELLLHEKMLTRQQLQEAMEFQERQASRAPLGDVLAELRFLSKGDLLHVLRKHKRRVYIGELLVNLGQMTKEDVEAALEIQRFEKKRLGKIFVENGFIAESSLVNLLSTQLGIPKIIPTPGLIDPALLKGVSKAFLLKNECLPAFRDGDTVTVIMSDPLSEETVRILEGVLNAKVEPAIASASEIETGIKLVFDDLKMIAVSADRAGKDKLGHLVIGDTASAGAAGDENATELLNYIVSNAITDRATDIHIEPMENMLRVRYRVDGVLKHKTDLPLFLAHKLMTRLRAISQMDLDDRRKHADGRLAVQVFNRRYDLRVAAYGSYHGESIAIRILPNQSNLMDLEMLGFSPANLQMYRQILNIPSGIIMSTGPSGSGKSTTVYASLRYLNGPGCKIVTVEDPVEYKIDGVVQGQINEKAGMGYKSFLRSIVRQDPDVVMVGEIRDKTSAEAIIEIALSGYKVVTTFHTEDSVQALLRMFGIGIESFLITSTLMAVVSQRLVRLLCPSCKVRVRPSDELLAAFDSIVPIDADSHEFCAPRGCSKCDNTGYKNRTAICEMLVINDPIRDAILLRSPYQAIRGIARESTEFVSLKEDGFYKASRGVTSLEEVLRVVPYNESDARLTRSCSRIVELSERGYATA